MPNDVVIHIKGKDEASAAIGGVQKKVGGLGSAFGSMANVAGGMVAASALQSGLTKVTGYLQDATAAAMEEEAEITRLRSSYKNAGGDMKNFNSWVNRNVESSIKLGFADDQTRDMLNKLTYETGSAAEAQKRLAIAQDLTRATGFDSSTIAKLLGKVTEENVNVFGRMGIVMDKNATKEQVMAKLQEKFGGQAAAYAKTTAGAVAIQSAKMHDLKEQIGAKLLPVQMAWAKLQVKIIELIAKQVEKYYPAMKNAFVEIRPTLEKLWSAFKTGLVTIAPLIKSFIEYVVNNKPVLIAAIVAIGAAILVALGPGAVAVAAIVGIITLVGYLKQHWEELPAPVQKALTLLGGIVKLGIDFIKTKIDGFILIFKSIYVIIDGVIKLVSDLFHGRWAQAWADLKQIAAGAVGLLIGSIKAQFGNLPVLILGLAKTVGTAALTFGQSIGNNLWAGFKAGINKVITAWNNLELKATIKAPFGLGEKTFTIGTPNIPPLDKGGLVTKTGLAEVHRGETYSGVGGAARGGGVTFMPGSIVVHGSILSERDIKRIIADAVREGGFRGLVAA